MNELLHRVLAPRDGAAGWFASAVRVVTGVLFVLFGIGKFADHMKEATDFESYGVPLPDISVWVSGTIEVVGGVLLVMGLLTRLAAAALAVNLVGRDLHGWGDGGRDLPPRGGADAPRRDAVPAVGRWGRVVPRRALGLTAWRAG